MNTSVLHISFSQSGGAGNVASILSQTRAEAGLPTSHSFFIEKSLRAAPWSAPRHTFAAVVDDALIRRQDFRAPISLARDNVRRATREDFNSWDVLHLHSVNGVFSLSQLAKHFPSKRVIWTLHDMNPMTGACHYSLGCAGYLADCASCPAVHRAFQGRVQNSLSRKVFSLKKLTNLTVVAPSQWLANLAADSVVFKDLPIQVIPNPIRPIFCMPLGNSGNVGNYTFCIIAQNLSDPVKNVGTAVEAFRELKKTYPQISLALIGNNANLFLGEGVSALGNLSAREIVETLTCSGALIVPSLAENSPLIIAEAAARGTVALVRNVGGMPEMVRSLGFGQVFSNSNDLRESMSTVIRGETLGAQASRNELSSRATAIYSPNSISQQYDAIYSG